MVEGLLVEERGQGGCKQATRRAGRDEERSGALSGGVISDNATF